MDADTTCRTAGNEWEMSTTTGGNCCRLCIRCLLLGCLTVVLLGLPRGSFPTQVYTIGGDAHPWTEADTLIELDVRSRPGWIRPAEVRPDENLAFVVWERGGRIWSTWSNFAQMGRPEYLVDRGSMAGDRPYCVPTYIASVSDRGWIYLDLGNQYGVNRVKVFSYTRSSNLEQMMIGLNDGDKDGFDGRGNPLLRSVWSEEIPAREDVDARFDPQPARYVGLEILNGTNMGLSELEVYGEGYVPESTFLSKVLDFGTPAAWGRIRWKGRKDPGSRILIRTRTGADDDPNMYWRQTGISGELVPTSLSGGWLTRREYERLDPTQAGPITYDTRNWSFWSAPYDFDEGSRGVQVVSPGARQYLQIKIEFLNTFERAGELDEVSFDYSTRLAVHGVIGEIFPIEAKPGEVTTFTYAIRPEITRGKDTGFDSMEILTPAQVDRVRGVRMDEMDVPFGVKWLEGSSRFVVHFEKVETDGQLVEVVFDAVVLRYGTEFRGKVYLDGVEEIPLWVAPGDAKSEIESEDLCVRILLNLPLIVSAKVAPDPFTPNGDGLNDEVTITYEISQLTAPAPVKVTVYTLSGRPVRIVYSGEESSGRYSCMWDGRDERGRMVPPGIYVYRIHLCPDVGDEGNVGTVSVVY